MAKCRSCGAEIYFVTTTNLKKMPVDPKPTKYWAKEGAKEKLVKPTGEVTSCSLEGEEEKADGYGYVPHFATCPNYKR